MSLITDVWQQLVQRRLWPVAALLLAALVAVPVLLHKDPAPAPAAPVTLPETGAKDGATAKPVVALAADSDSLGRHVLGAAKDPFAPAPVPHAHRSHAGASTASGAPASSSGSGTPVSVASSGGSPTPPANSGGGESYFGGGGQTDAGGTPSGGSPAATSPSPAPTPAPTPVTPAPAPKPQYPADSLTVRFGTGDGDLAESTLEPLAALPEEAAGDETPVLVYLGLVDGGREATFLLDDSVTAQGDGRCDSDGGTACDTLHLRAGETEFLDVTDETGTVTASYELDLVTIHARTAKGARASRAVRAAQASRHRPRVTRPLARRVARAFAPRADTAQAADARMAHVVAVLEPGM